jgi:hypothetical protein
MKYTAMLAVFVLGASASIAFADAPTPSKNQVAPDPNPYRDTKPPTNSVKALATLGVERKQAWADPAKTKPGSTASQPNMQIPSNNTNNSAAKTGAGKANKKGS